MAVRYLSKESAGRHLPPPGLRTLHPSAYGRIERSGLNLLFLPFALVKKGMSPHTVQDAVWNHQLNPTVKTSLQK